MNFLAPHEKVCCISLAGPLLFSWPALSSHHYDGLRSNAQTKERGKMKNWHFLTFSFQPIWKQLPSEAAHKHQLPGDLHSSAGGQTLPASDKSYRARLTGHALPGRASSKQRGFSCCPWNHLPDEYFCFFLHLQSTAGCTSALQRCKIHTQCLPPGHQKSSFHLNSSSVFNSWSATPSAPVRTCVKSICNN